MILAYENVDSKKRGETMQNAMTITGAATNAIHSQTRGALVLNEAKPLDQNAAAVYLASLAPGSRPAMQGALNVLARLLGAPRVDNDAGKEITCLLVNWATLRFQLTAALRAKLAETYKARTANKILSALRGTLKAAWRLEQMDAETFLCFEQNYHDVYHTHVLFIIPK